MANWEQTGANIVHASADFLQGIGSAAKGLGNRFKRGSYNKFIETFCAVVGDVASQNGRLLSEEINSFKKFLLDNRHNPAFSSFQSDELVTKMKKYAINAFLCEEEQIVRAVEGVEPGSDFAKLVIIGAIAIAFADGNCDTRESSCILKHAQQLSVNLIELSKELNINIPNIFDKEPTQSLTEISPPKQISDSQAANQEVCPFCNGKGCAFCKGTGKKS